MGGALGLIGRGCPTTCVTLMKTVGTCSNHCHIVLEHIPFLRVSLLSKY